MYWYTGADIYLLWHGRTQPQGGAVTRPCAYPTPPRDGDASSRVFQHGSLISTAIDTNANRGVQLMNDGPSVRSTSQSWSSVCAVSLTVRSAHPLQVTLRNLVLLTMSPEPIYLPLMIQNPLPSVCLTIGIPDLAFVTTVLPGWLSGPCCGSQGA